MEDDEVGGNGELTSETHKESHLPAAFSGVYTSAQVRDIFEIELDQDNSSDRDGASTILEETESISVGEVMKSPFFSENESSDNSFWIDLGHNPMGFDYASQRLHTRAKAEEALRMVETNSVELAMKWLFSRPEDHVQEDDELARALASSLGSSSETSKVESIDKSMDILTKEGQTKAPPIDDITLMKLFQSSGTMAFPLIDLFVILCNRSKGEDRSKVVT
uniref:Uncharacterized protein n=1 Tax=Vitis vinifera TaxID=29760 RepID=F6H846_VITVI